MSPARKTRPSAFKAEDASASGAGPRPVSAETEARASPARDLQVTLADSLASRSPDEPHRWSGAVRLTIICGGSAALWGGIIAVCKALW